MDRPSCRRPTMPQEVAEKTIDVTSKTVAVVRPVMASSNLSKLAHHMAEDTISAPNAVTSSLAAPTERSTKNNMCRAQENAMAARRKAATVMMTTAMMIIMRKK